MVVYFCAFTLISVTSVNLSKNTVYIEWEGEESPERNKKSVVVIPVVAGIITWIIHESPHKLHPSVDARGDPAPYWVSSNGEAGWNKVLKYPRKKAARTCAVGNMAELDIGQHCGVDDCKQLGKSVLLGGSG